MSSSEPMEFVPDEISILEWYDGVVRGIAESQGKLYLVTVAAWDPDRRRRAYILIDVDLATATEMKSLCNWRLGDQADEERWHRFDQIYNQYLRNYKGPAYLSNEEPVATRRIDIKSITTDHLHELLDYDLEKTMDLEARTLWFGMQ